MIALSSPTAATSKASWSHQHYNGAKRDILIARLAASGLGLSGDEKALARLRALADNAESAEVRNLLSDVVDEAIKRNLKVHSKGLEKTLAPSEPK